MSDHRIDVGHTPQTMNAATNEEFARLRARLATAREALHRLSHYHSSPLQDVAQTTKHVRQIAAGTLAAMDGEEG